MLLLLGLCLTLPYKQQQQTPGAVLQVNSQGHFQYASTSWFARALGLLQSSGVEGIAVDVWVSVLLVLKADAALLVYRKQMLPTVVQNRLLCMLHHPSWVGRCACVIEQ